MSKTIKKLQLRRETILHLGNDDLADVVGGVGPVSWLFCRKPRPPQPNPSGGTCAGFQCVLPPRNPPSPVPSPGTFGFCNRPVPWIEL
jgi:hypothetical protein